MIGYLTAVGYGAILYFIVQALTGTEYFFRDDRPQPRRRRQVPQCDFCDDPAEEIRPTPKGSLKWCSDHRDDLMAV